MTTTGSKSTKPGKTAEIHIMPGAKAPPAEAGTLPQPEIPENSPETEYDVWLTHQPESASEEELVEAWQDREGMLQDLDKIREHVSRGGATQFAMACTTYEGGAMTALHARLDPFPLMGAVEALKLRLYRHLE